MSTTRRWVPLRAPSNQFPPIFDEDHFDAIAAECGGSCDQDEACRRWALTGAALRRAEIECAHMEGGGDTANNLRDEFSLEIELRAVWRYLARLAEGSPKLDAQASPAAGNAQPDASVQDDAHHAPVLEAKAVDLAEGVESRGPQRNLGEVDAAISELQEAMSSAKAEHARQSNDFEIALKDVREQMKMLDGVMQELAENVVLTAQETAMLLQALAVESLFTPQVTPAHDIQRSVSAPENGEPTAPASDVSTFWPPSPGRRPGRVCTPSKLKIQTDMSFPPSPSRPGTGRGNTEGGFSLDQTVAQEMLGVRENLMQIRQSLLQQQQLFSLAACDTPTGDATQLSIAIPDEVPHEAEFGLQSIPEAVSPDRKTASVVKGDS